MFTCFLCPIALAVALLRLIDCAIIGQFVISVKEFRFSRRFVSLINIDKGHLAPGQWPK